MTDKELERKAEAYYLGLDNKEFPLGGCSSRYQRLIMKAFAEGQRAYARWIEENCLKLPYNELLDELRETGGIEEKD